MSNEIEYNINCGIDVREQQFDNLQWSLPSHIIVFLSSAIATVREKPLKLTPWPQFKTTLFDIIDNRIEYAPEINGVVNTCYVSMDEHLVCYWCCTYLTPLAKMKQQFNGTREEV